MNASLVHCGEIHVRIFRVMTRFNFGHKIVINVALLSIYNVLYMYLTLCWKKLGSKYLSNLRSKGILDCLHATCNRHTCDTWPHPLIIILMANARVMPVSPGRLSTVSHHARLLDHPAQLSWNPLMWVKACMECFDVDIGLLWFTSWAPAYLVCECESHSNLQPSLALTGEVHINNLHRVSKKV